MAKQDGRVGQGKPQLEREEREVITPTPPALVLTEGKASFVAVPGITPMTNWEKFKQRLFSLRGQMVTITIMVSRDGEPMCWSTPEERRLENLPPSNVR